MKNLILFVSVIISFPIYSSNVLKLADLANQNLVQQVLNYPSLSPEDKEKFNESFVTHGTTSGLLNFKGQPFDYYNFKGIRLLGVSFEGARLNGVNFEDADLRYCNFKGATFKNTNLKNSILIGVKFEGCNFQGADLHGAVLTETLQIPYYVDTAEILKLYSNLPSGKDKEILNQLIGTGYFNFKNQKVENLDLSGINFKNCDLRHIVLTQCNLTGALFENTILGDADLSGVKLSPDFQLPSPCKPKDLIELYGNYRTTQEQKNLLNLLLGLGITFRSISPQEIKFDGLNLSGINLNILKLKLSQLPLNFRDIGNDANSIKVSFRNCNFLNASLNLNGIPLGKAQFQGSIFVEGSKIPEYKDGKDLLEIYSQSSHFLEKENIKKLVSSVHINLMSEVFWLDTYDKTNLKGFNLTGLDLSNIDIRGASLQKAVVLDGIEFPDYKTDADLLRLYSNSTDLKFREKLNRLIEIFPMDLISENLDGLDLTGIRFSPLSVLSHASLKKTILKDAVLPPKYNRLESYLSEATLPDGSQVISYDRYEDLFRRYSTSDPETRKNLNQIFENTRVGKENQTWNGIDLSGICLKGRKFFNQYQRDTYLFHGVNFQKANFKDSNLEGIRFDNCDLQGSDFTYANLVNVYFKDCKLQGALFFNGFKVPSYNTGADLIRYYANSKDPKERQNLNKLFDMINLKLWDALLRDLDLEGLNLTNTYLGMADFTGSNMTNTFIETPLEHLREAKLEGTRWAKDFILPYDLSKESLKEMYSVDMTDSQKYWFKMIYQEIKGYDGLKDLLNSSSKD